MKIILDARMAKMSGIGRYIDSIVPFLKKNFELILLGNSKELEPYGAEIINTFSRPYSPLGQIELPLKIPRADLYWTPHFNAPLLPSHAKKMIVTIHDVFHMTGLYHAGFLSRSYARLIYSGALAGSDLVFTISRFTKSEIIAYFPFMNRFEDKIKVIPRYPDSKFRQLKKSEREKTEFLSSRNLPGSFILYVGNIKPHKNIEGLLRAIWKLRGKNTGLSLLCVGQRDNFLTGYKNLEELIDKLGIKSHVYFTGILDDEELVNLYNYAKVLALPSFYEGFGLPPLEAMACGCPVLVSSIPPLREICGDAGFYVEPSSYESIAEGIMEICYNEKLRESLVRKGSLQVLKYDREEIEKEYFSCLNMLSQ